MIKKGVTLKDIATKLNVSISSVAKSLGDDNSISALTKNGVEEVALKENHNILLTRFGA